MSDIRGEVRCRAPRGFSVIVLSACVFVQCQGQAQFAIEWQVGLGGTNYEACTSVVQTEDGGTVLGGYSSSGPSGNKTATNYGGSDYWITKLDTEGTIEWQKVHGGSSSDVLLDLKTTPDGGFILVGQSFSGVSGNKTNVVAGQTGDRDYWLVKTDGAGNKQWDVEYGGNDNERASHVVTTADGYVVAGNSASGISGNKSADGFGGDDWWIVKVGTNGLKQWDIAYGGTERDSLFWIEPTGTDGYLLAGGSLSGGTGLKFTPNYGLEDGWVMKIDTGGIYLWEMNLGGTNGDYFSFAAPATDGGYLLGGASESGPSGNKTSPNYGGFDWWLIKLDSNGVKQWERSYGGSGGDVLTGLIPYQDGYLLYGTSRSDIGGNKTVSSFGRSHYWVVKVDIAGFVEWQQAFGGDEWDDAAKAIRPTPDGGVLLAGESDSPISGDKTVPIYGDYDFWIIKLIPEPTLAIDRQGLGLAKISWVPSTGTNWVLQETVDLSLANWTLSVSGSTNPVTVPAGSGMRYFRLVNP